MANEGSPLGRKPNHDTGLSGLTANNHHAKLHAADHIDGTDDIQEASSSQKGLSGKKHYMHGYAGTQVTRVIDAVDVVHPATCLTIGESANISTVLGVAGTGDITDGTGGKILITSAGHTNEDGEIVLITNTTNYNGIYVVESADVNTFKVTKAYVADEAGKKWYRPCQHVIPTGGDGVYDVDFALTGDSAANNKIFDSAIYINTVKSTAQSKAQFTTGAAWNTLTSHSFPSLVAGDRLWLALVNLSDATDFVIEYENLTIKRL